MSVEQVRRAVKLAQKHGIRVGMFLMWGYEGEELEDIAATVEHVKQSNPDIFFTTVSYPIKGTAYFNTVSDKVRLPIPWRKQRTVTTSSAAAMDATTIASPISGCEMK